MMTQEDNKKREKTLALAALKNISGCISFPPKAEQLAIHYLDQASDGSVKNIFFALHKAAKTKGITLDINKLSHCSSYSVEEIQNYLGQKNEKNK